MKKIIVESLIEVYENIEELDATAQDLFHKAIEATKHTHSPYSNFAVGAALLLENGKMVTGSNQENASFPAGICAEGVALSAASSLYPGVPIIKIAVTALAKGKLVDNTTPPCGICRQRLKEYESRFNEPIEIYFPGKGQSIYKVKSTEALLPLSFNAEHLI